MESSTRKERGVMSILRGLGSRCLSCGCTVGLYETYDSRAVAILDVRADACGNASHQPNAQLDLAAQQLGIPAPAGGASEHVLPPLGGR